MPTHTPLFWDGFGCPFFRGVAWLRWLVPLLRLSPCVVFGSLSPFPVLACFCAHFRAVLPSVSVCPSALLSFVFGRFNGLFLGVAYLSTVAPFPLLAVLAFLLLFFGAFRLFSCNLSRQIKKPVLGAIFKAFCVSAFPLPFGCDSVGVDYVKRIKKEGASRQACPRSHLVFRFYCYCARFRRSRRRPLSSAFQVLFKSCAVCLACLPAVNIYYNFFCVHRVALRHLLPFIKPLKK